MILVVDDHRDTRTILVKVLIRDGYEATAVPDGVDALGLMQSWVPELVLLGLHA